MVQRPYSISGEDLWQWQQAARQQAIAHDISPAEVDWVLQEVAGLDRLALHLASFKDAATVPLSMPTDALIEGWQRRINERIPVQYVVGRSPWREFSLIVSPAVLIPRPETEGLIELAKLATQHNPRLATGDWADLGTGSGAIALGLAASVTQATVHAVDQSAAALDVARQNAEQTGLIDRIQFYQGSWFEPLQMYRHNLCGVVSNPPYIPSDMVLQLQPEVVNHEPHLALDGGDDGLDCIRLLVTQAPDYLIEGGVWLIEMMAGQADAVAALLHQDGRYSHIQTKPDLEGVERFAIAYRNPF